MTATIGCSLRDAVFKHLESPRKSYMPWVDGQRAWPGEDKTHYSPVFVTPKDSFDDIKKAMKALVPRTIVDAGAGYGFHMLHRLSKVCKEVHGVEMHADAVEMGNAFFKQKGLPHRIFHGQIEQFDFSGYDMVYSYHPAASVKAQLRIDKKTLKSMSPGAFYVRLYEVQPLEETGLCIRISESTYNRSLWRWAIFQRI